MSAQENPILENLKTMLGKMKTKYAPDKRTAIWNIELEESEGTLTLLGETNQKVGFEELKTKISGNSKILNKIKLLPAENLGEKIYGIVNLSAANIRSKPDHPAELATQALLGTTLKVLKEDEGFFLVQTPDEYISWIDEDGFIRVTQEELLDWINSEKIIYLSEYGFAYSEPNSSSLRVSDLVLGNLLQHVEESGEFVKVKYPDGRLAYVEKSLLMNYKAWLGLTNPTAENILATANKFMGVPYLWGGTSAKALDCSGFTKTVFYMNGLVLPRDASQQVHTGELIDTKDGFQNLLPGDLLFFGFKATPEKKERITHVAIYLGDNEYIHAAGRVRINSFDQSKPNFSQFRYDHFIRAKRILNSIDKNGITTLKSNMFYTGEDL